MQTQKQSNQNNQLKKQIKTKPNKINNNKKKQNKNPEIIVD